MHLQRAKKKKKKKKEEEEEKEKDFLTRLDDENLSQLPKWTEK